MKFIKPFLKWAGGKQKLLNYLLPYIPENISDLNYHEPFLGAGSLFLNIHPKKSFLSDLNHQLINAYKAIKVDPEKVYQKIDKHRLNHSKEYYYIIRDNYNKNIFNFTLDQAANFIYLNKSSFNGIYRVNMNGLYNVPYGNKIQPALPSLEELYIIHNLLKKVSLNCYSYEKIIKKVKADDFIYLDPPYPPLSDNSYFSHYTKERFYSEDQMKLSKFANELNSTGCKVMISNADIPEIKSLYYGWNYNVIDVKRYITCKKEKHIVQECIITNY